MGARPLRRVIEQYLEDPLAEKLLLNPGKGGSWSVSAEDSKLTFTEQEPPENPAKNGMAIAVPSDPHQK
jgi:ATP-dependent Clp protease ATP-binding subunit ClpA